MMSDLGMVMRVKQCTGQDIMDSKHLVRPEKILHIIEGLNLYWQREKTLVS